DPRNRVESQPLERHLADHAMGDVRWFEGPAEQANGLAGSRIRRVGLEAAEAGGRGGTHYGIGRSIGAGCRWPNCSVRPSQCERSLPLCAPGGVGSSSGTSVREDVLVLEASEVEARSLRQEAEARLGGRHPALAH